jgi:hypothetical protein
VELSTAARQAASTLGWTQTTWDASGPPPSSENKFWSQLCNTESNAAKVLCYDQHDWDDIPLNQRGAAGGAGCFSGQNKIQVQGRGRIDMKDLRIGDYVQVSGGKFSRVYSFLHLDRDSEMVYMQIYTRDDDNDHDGPLEISPDHMIFVNNQIQKAEDVRVGDWLGLNLRRVVVDIRSVRRRGIYNPGTEDGTIVVSGILASSYPAVLDISPSIVQVGTHFILSPFRFTCAVRFDEYCKTETYTDGLTDHYHYIFRIAFFVRQCSIVTQFFASLLSFPLLMSAFLLERLAWWIMHTPFPCATMTAAAVVTVVMAKRYFSWYTARAWDKHLVKP